MHGAECLRVYHHQHNMSRAHYATVNVKNSLRLLSGQRPCRNGKGAGRDVWLHEICRGSGVALQGPRPRAKSPALQARLAELQRKLDQHQYDTMLQGIAEKVGGLKAL